MTTNTERTLFLSIPEDEIFQAGLSNIENIINLFKYANERRSVKNSHIKILQIFDPNKGPSSGTITSIQNHMDNENTNG
jgi:hypothetical protein